MSHERIAVGSKRGPKLEAVHEALKQFAPLLGAELEVHAFEVESGVGHTPLSSRESMLGARQRAEALMRVAHERGESFRYYVGLEGGLEVFDSRRVFLESWAYVSDGTRGHYGRSGAIELPEALAYEVVERKIELGVAIDQFAGKVGIRDGQGAWGILSRDLITRREAFRVALVTAFAPFYNATLFPAA